MANIKLKRLFEAEDFKAKSKETGKLVHFKSKDAYQAALKAGTHEDPNAEKGAVSKASAKPNDMFSGDYANDRGGDSSKSKNADYFAKIQKLFKDNPGLEKYTMDQWNKLSNAPNQPSAKLTPDSKIVKLLSKKTGVNGRASISWAEQNGVDLEKIASDVESKKLNPMDFMTAVTGNAGNEYAKAIIAKYSNTGAVNTTQQPKAQLPKKASKLNYKHAEVLEKAVNAETGLKGYVDTDEYNDAIMYNASKGNMPTYTLYFGGNSDYNKPDEFRVSLLPTYGNDPAKLGDTVDKTFQNGDEAMKFMVAVAKKYKKELEMDDEDTNESTKLTSMIKK